MIDSVFAPLMLVGLLRMVPRLFARRTARWLHDRALVALLLALATLAGMTVPAVELMSLLLIAGALIQSPLGARSAAK
jgi:hypothetical protein